MSIVLLHKLYDFFADHFDTGLTDLALPLHKTHVGDYKVLEIVQPLFLKGLAGTAQRAAIDYENLVCAFSAFDKATYIASDSGQTGHGSFVVAAEPASRAVSQFSYICSARATIDESWAAATGTSYS
jgi:hypothetical protein